ncbi:hypothetical protein CRV08_04370 [Halarcobacter ebronensis]|uniref:Tetratricopeptide repeat protein n=1 Tax=Halarcobacter ebronensis TaxID=1462615 RepID=A0A4Q0YFC5_9BACT|nr:hypothetical protein [Halarcobacter ebronensis]RXJ69250.1 hypothetical protein CRV08_04370 [Halarcobacter ebronensis]
MQQPDNNLIKTNFKYKVYAQEDRDILFALEYLKNGNQKDSSLLFEELFLNTLNDEYLLESVKLKFALKEYENIVNLVESNKENLKANEDSILKIYILSLLQMNQYEKAEIEISKLLEKDESEANFELLGNIYIQRAEFVKAKELFERLYEEKKSANALISLANIMFYDTNEKQKATKLLQTYVTMNGCKNIVCSKLLKFYEEENNLDGVILVLKRTYYDFQESNETETRNKIYNLLMFYLEKKGINEAIAFLEESKANDKKLLSLYRDNKQYEKAYFLANKLYEKSLNIDYLAQIAILEFEMAKDKRKVLDSVIKKFNDVLTVLDNHVYQNYLGYILIDFDIDVKKGIMFVKKALEKAPNNLAYIDSLAWGQYKLKDCKNAYINMKKVVDTVGTEEEEIRIHWEKIKECSK